jgi:hypothetical protein
MATAYSLDVASELSLETARPVMVIASRRQVDCVTVDGGYVGWDTSEWCARAFHLNNSGTLLLARDHGGPYQHPWELGQEASTRDVMLSALHSFRCDIESGVELLHIDTGLGEGGVPEEPTIAIQRAVELVAGCTEIADELGRVVRYEVGIEAQNETIADPLEVMRHLGPLLDELRRHHRVSPAFVVTQTGTKVIGRQNTGLLQRRSPSGEEPTRLGKLANAIQSLDTRLKAHNADYLGDEAIRELHSVGAWMNISPELGCAQTIAVLAAARAARLDQTLDGFCNATIEAGYWRRWVEGTGQEATDLDKVVLGGSYLFATPVFVELRDQLDRALQSRELSTRRIAIDAGKAVARRYCG